MAPRGSGRRSGSVGTKRKPISVRSGSAGKKPRKPRFKK